MTRYLCDTNIWLALCLSGHRHHAPCLRWFDAVHSAEAVLMPRQVHMSLLRLLTTPAVLQPYDRAPLTNDEAWAVCQAIVADERVQLALDEPLDLTAGWQESSSRTTASPKLWMDAYLAAYAVAEDCTLVTLDAAFDQFAGLKMLNPAARSTPSPRRGVPS